MATRAKYLTPNVLGNLKAGYVLKQLYLNICDSGLPMRLSSKGCAHQCRRWRFDPWIGKISWRRKWQPTPVFLLGKSHGQRRLAGYSPWGCKRVRHDSATKQQLSGKQPPSRSHQGATQRGLIKTQVIVLLSLGKFQGL